MGSQLRGEIARHSHPRDSRHIHLSAKELEQREIHFMIIAAPDAPRGKRKKFYEVREIHKESVSAKIEDPKHNTPTPYAVSIPGTLEICPYIRNITQTGETTYDGTCALKRTPCLNHHAYPIGKDPNCEPYNTVWYPKTAEQAEAIRNASVNDLVAFLDESEIVRLLKEGI